MQANWALTRRLYGIMSGTNEEAHETFVAMQGLIPQPPRAPRVLLVRFDKIVEGPQTVIQHQDILSGRFRPRGETLQSLDTGWTAAGFAAKTSMQPTVGWLPPSGSRGALRPTRGTDDATSAVEAGVPPTGAAQVWLNADTQNRTPITNRKKEEGERHWVALRALARQLYKAVFKMMIETGGLHLLAMLLN